MAESQENGTRAVYRNDQSALIIVDRHTVTFNLCSGNSRTINVGQKQPDLLPGKRYAHDVNNK
jgi:hypothetical protein